MPKTRVTQWSSDSTVPFNTKIILYGDKTQSISLNESLQFKSTFVKTGAEESLAQINWKLERNEAWINESGPF